MLDRDSYLFFPGLIARERIERTRFEVLTALDEMGWLRPGEPIDSAVPSDKAQPEGVAPFDVYLEAYAKVQAVQSFHELAHEQAVLGVLRPHFCPLIPDFDVLAKGWTSHHSHGVPSGVTIAADGSYAAVTPQLVTLKTE